MPNCLEAILEVLEPHWESLMGVAVESTFNWYWLVAGQMDAVTSSTLVNTSAVQVPRFD